MKAIVNGIKKEYTPEEITYLKLLYGDWEKRDDCYIFTRLDFLPVREIAKLLDIEATTVYKRNSRDPERFPLEDRSGVMGINSDNFLKHWI